MKQSEINEFLKSIYKGYWLSLSYKNNSGGITHYWANITSISANGCLTAQCYNVGTGQFAEKLNMHLEEILSCKTLEETYHPLNSDLILNVEKNKGLFPTVDSAAESKKTLDYFVECHKYDSTPYQSNFTMVEGIDNSKFVEGSYQLSQEQFSTLVRRYEFKSKKSKVRNLDQEIVFNILSMSTLKGLYVLAYKKLRLDIAEKKLVPDSQIQINYSFACSGKDINEVSAITQFLPEEDQDLLLDFKTNAEKIKKSIIANRKDLIGFVDDRPYVIFLERNIGFDLKNEYQGIIDAYDLDSKTVPAPMRVYFGERVDTSRRRPKPFVLFDPDKVNLDQLRVINDAMKNDVTYVQGPPGTGKTSTILSVILTAMFNDMTVLVSSYNNHPVDGINDSFSKLKFNGTTINLPIVRLGNSEEVGKSLDKILLAYHQIVGMKVYGDFLENSKTKQTDRTKKLVDLLETYETKLLLEERLDAIGSILKDGKAGMFSVGLQTKQKSQIVEELSKISDITDETVKPFLEQDQTALLKYLYYFSINRLLRLGKSENKELFDILSMPHESESERDARAKSFAKHIANPENLAAFVKIFPVVLTTNASAYRLGEPKPFFDLTIMDEASQCNSAVALVPIMRAKRLLLVGDPQQLNPVILLDPNINRTLRARFAVSERYDYIGKSIYKSFLAVDPISDEILLKNHYRCSPKIIEFNNKKFYNNKLRILSTSKVADPLILVDHPQANSVGHNTSESEANSVIKYIKEHPNESIGVITPFVRQKELLKEMLAAKGIDEKKVTCGTVHAFQGDEKDVILFSTAITSETGPKTYKWLKDNIELLNVATSRPKDRLVLLTDMIEVQRLHGSEPEDNFYDLCKWVSTNGACEVSNCSDHDSAALGFKPYSTEAERAFMDTLDEALSNLSGADKYVCHHNSRISDVLKGKDGDSPLFYSGHFDFVIYRKKTLFRDEMPVFAFEVNGPEHIEDSRRAECDRQKKEICLRHRLELIIVENSFVRRYEFIKSILSNQFSKAKE